jgi:hypothetical protein
LAVESHDAGDVSWGVSLSDVDTGFRILFAWEAETPGNGSHPVAGTSTASTFEALITLDSLLDQYLATSGTITIRSSSDTRVEGSFTFSALYNGLDAAFQGMTVTVTGDFTATNVIDTGTT